MAFDKEGKPLSADESRTASASGFGALDFGRGGRDAKIERPADPAAASYAYLTLSTPEKESGNPVRKAIVPATLELELDVTATAQLKASAVTTSWPVGLRRDFTLELTTPTARPEALAALPAGIWSYEVRVPIEIVETATPFPGVDFVKDTPTVIWAGSVSIPFTFGN